MKEEKIELSFTRAKLTDLSKEDQSLISKAKHSVKHAYAPYSGFLVGASLLLDNGEIVTGSNQENVAYPSGLCAERVALFYAGATYPNNTIKTIAITAESKTFDINDVISPCGSCRQVMAEYQERQEKNIKILLHAQDNEILIVKRVEDLLPFMFTNPFLKKY